MTILRSALWRYNYLLLSWAGELRKTTFPSKRRLKLVNAVDIGSRGQR